MSKPSAQTAVLLSLLLVLFGLDPRAWYGSRAEPRAANSWITRARAHGGDVAQVLSIVATDAQGPTILQLNEGLALRRPEGFRFVCPARWGDDTIVPVQAIPGGPALIGASSGLYLLHEQGTVLRHPALEARGRVIALAATPSAVLALRDADGERELLEVRADSVQRLWRASEPWEDLAVGADFVALARISEDRVRVLRVSLGGEALDELSAPLDNPFAHVRLRVLGSETYAVLITSSLTFQLGRIEPEHWLALATAQNIVGPIEYATGARFVALDGALSRLEAGRATALGEPASISCLGHVGALSYACSERGVHRLETAGLGAALFELSALLEPELASVPEEERSTCMLQWQRYTIDLMRAGIQPGSLDAGAIAAGDAGARDPALQRPTQEGAIVAVDDDAALDPLTPGASQSAAPAVEGAQTDDSTTDERASEEADTPSELAPEKKSSPRARHADGGSCQLSQPSRKRCAAAVLCTMIVLLGLRRRGVAL